MDISRDIARLISTNMNYDQYRATMKDHDYNKNIHFIMKSDMKTVKKIFKAIKKSIG